MNKYLKRGLILLGIGVGLSILGQYMKDTEMTGYSVAMVLGVTGFGVGFITIIYSLIRKIERRSILESREVEERKAS